LLSDITGIVFGGTSTRFWMLRKHMNSITPQDYRTQSIPFYSWECITLQLRHRVVDLVIRNQDDMDDFLMILIDALKTVDGNRGSIVQAYKSILKEKRRLHKNGIPAFSNYEDWSQITK
jgi:hypothetical protein